MDPNTTQGDGLAQKSGVAYGQDGHRWVPFGDWVERLGIGGGADQSGGSTGHWIGVLLDLRDEEPARWCGCFFGAAGYGSLGD